MHATAPGHADIATWWGPTTGRTPPFGGRGSGRTGGRWTRGVSRPPLIHSFRAFAVRGTAPEEDDHRCVVTRAVWRREGDRLLFEVEANRFLHHMVRFLVGTMLDEGSGRRAEGTVRRLLDAEDNREVSPPAPPHALYLERVDYPPDLYLSTPDSA